MNMSTSKSALRTTAALAGTALLMAPALAAVVTPPIQPPSVNGPNNAGPKKLPDPPADRSGECDANCLTDIARTYLAALAARDYSKLQVKPTLMVTENGQPSRIGDGLWRVLEKMDPQTHFLADPVQGEVVSIGTVRESADQPFILIVRLKIEERRIAEVETMLTSDIDAGQHFRPDLVAAFDPTLLAPLAAADRPSRQELAAASDAWWYDQGKGLTASADCVHWENMEPLPVFKCSVGNKRGSTALSYANRAIRDVILDPERGLVMTYLLSDTTPYANPNPPDNERTPLFYRQPLTTYKIQLIKVRKGGVVAAHHVFMNYQTAGLRALFTR